VSRSTRLLSSPSILSEVIQACSVDFPSFYLRDGQTSTIGFWQFLDHHSELEARACVSGGMKKAWKQTRRHRTGVGRSPEISGIGNLLIFPDDSLADRGGRFDAEAVSAECSTTTISPLIEHESTS